MIAPAIVHSRAPQPLVGIVLHQHGDEGDNRVIWQDRIFRQLLFHFEQDRCRVRHPPPIFPVNDRHLDRADFFLQLIGLLIGHAVQCIGYAFVSQIGFQLACIIGHPRSVDFHSSLPSRLVHPKQDGRQESMLILFRVVLGEGAGRNR